VFLLFRTNAAGHNAHHCLGDLHGRPLAKLTKELVIEQGRDVDEVYLRQQVHQGVSNIKNGNLATGAGVQPIFHHIYRHIVTSFIEDLFSLTILFSKLGIWDQSTKITISQ